MPTTTTNFGLNKPDVNNPDDADLWGGYLNGDMDELDTIVKASLNSTTTAQTASFSVTAPTSGSATIGSSNAFFPCDATSGAIVVSLPTVATAGAGFRVAFKKIDSSANAVTLTANGSEKIDGSTTFVLGTQYNWAILVCDGTAWNILSDTPTTNTVKTIKIQAFTTSGTYTPSAGLIEAVVEMVGGGGGGGGSIPGGGSSAGGGGGSGGYAKVLLTAAQISSSQTITIGAAGAAGTSSGGTGGNGTTTSIGSLISCSGGSGGVGATFNNTPYAGGAGGSATVSVGTPMVSMSGQSGSNGHSYFTAIAGTGGSNPLGYGGIGPNGGQAQSYAGVAGTGYGYGGSGAVANSGGQAGAAGGLGYIVITEYCSQ